jgi:hypothetical protein
LKAANKAMRKNLPIWLAIFAIYLCFAVMISSGQTGFKSVGNIGLMIESNRPVPFSKYNFNVPVNEKFPLLRGFGLRIESTHGDSYELFSMEIAEKNNTGRALLKVTLAVSKYRDGLKMIQKKFKLKKGQKKNFRLKYNQFDFEITAYYQPENETI